MQFVEIGATLVVSFFFVILGCFNPGSVQVDLFGARTFHLPVPVIMVCMFLTGAGYMAFWEIFERVRKHMTISNLEKRVKELEKKLKEGGKPSQSVENAAESATEPTAEMKKAPLPPPETGREVPAGEGLQASTRDCADEVPVEGKITKKRVPEIEFVLGAEKS